MVKQWTVWPLCRSTGQMPAVKVVKNMAAVKRWTGGRHFQGWRAACELGTGWEGGREGGWVGGWVVGRDGGEGGGDGGRYEARASGSRHWSNSGQPRGKRRPVIDRSAASPRRAARLRMTRMVRETVSAEWARNRAVSCCSAGGRRSPPSHGARLSGPREAAGGAAVRRSAVVAVVKLAMAAAPEEPRRASGLLATGRNLSS